MPIAVAMSESTLLGLQSSIGVALANSLEVHRKEEALVRLRSCRVCLYLFTAEIESRSQFVCTRRHDTEVDLNGVSITCLTACTVSLALAITTPSALPVMGAGVVSAGQADVQLTLAGNLAE